MRLFLRKFGIFILFFLYLISCAKHSSVKTLDKDGNLLIAKDTESVAYLEFIKSELTRFDEKPDVSLNSINKSISIEPGSGYLYYQRALINATLGNWDKVEDDCRIALKNDNHNIDAKILLAKALGVAKKNDEAIILLNDALSVEPDREDVYQLLAKEYMNVEQYQRAEKVMQDLLKKDSEALVAYYYLGAIYGAYLKDTNRAINIYKKILDREPENYQVMDAVSQLYMDIGENEKGLEMLLELEKQKPGDVSLQLKIAQIYYKEKKYEPAIARFEGVLKDNPKSDKIIYYLGVLYEEAGEAAKATAMFERVPPKSGLYKDARLRLAYGNKSAGNIQEAKKVLETGIRKDPNIVEFYQYLAGIHEREGDLEGAMIIIEQAVKKFPNDPQLFFALGSIHDRLGDYKEAMGNMRRVLEIDPKNAGALNYIGYMLTEQRKDLDEAEDMLQEAMLLKPEDGFIVDSLGWLYYVKGDYTKAYFLISKALKLVPNEPTVLKHMGQISMERGEKSKAIKYFKMALQEWQKREIVNEREIGELITLIQKATNGES